MLDPFAQLFQHCWGHARSLRMLYKDSWVVSFPRCTAGPNIVGSCCIRLHTTANMHATPPNIVGATMLGVVASVCTQPYDFLPFWLQSPSSLGTLRSDDGDGNGNATKAIGLISKTTILHVHHAFLYISLPSLHDYDVKIPNLTLYRGRTQATAKFPLSFCTWLWFLGIQL